MRHYLSVIPMLAVLVSGGIASSADAAAPEPATLDRGNPPVVVRMPRTAEDADAPGAAASEAVTRGADKAPVVVRMPRTAEDAGEGALSAPGEQGKSGPAPAGADAADAPAPQADPIAPVAPLPHNVSPAPTPAPTPSNAASAPSAYQTQRLTARNFFAILPTGIFEVTPEGLDERQKQELLVTGQTDFWELAGETDDVIVFTALPFRDGGVAVRLFRNVDDGSVLAAVGTLGGEMCTVELWRMDRNGRTIPVDTPQEPAVKEFFSSGTALPRNINPSVSICLGRGGLVARPIFWNSSGMVHLPLAHDISYQWDGHRFQKQVQAHRPDEVESEF